jgi:glycosyltransferase involved in cell wall biosynthesis
MKVSLITITFNSAETLEQTIFSVLNQTYRDIEYIIVDGGSTDGTLAIIDKYKNAIAKVVSEPDEGLYDALNKGLKLCTGEIIGLLHSDDFYIDQHVIQKYVSVFKETGCDAVYSDLYYVDRLKSDKIFRKWKSGQYKSGSFINGWMPPHPTFFVRKKIYDKFGSFNTSLKSAADYELMLRFIHKHRIALRYLPEFTVKMRVGGASNLSLRKRFMANREDKKAWAMNGLKPRFYTFFLKPLRKVFQFL